MIPVLLLVTALFRPAAPTVGDPITVQFPAPVTLEPSPHYEIVSQRGNTVVIRTFQPRPFVISGRVGDVLFRNMVVPVHTVLKPNDDMAPAPLKPPRREPYPRLPFVAMAVAALAAIAAWTAAALRRDKILQPAIPALPPAEQFRATVVALRDDPRIPRRWARLADALRDYLAATTELGRDLTTSEVIGVIPSRNDGEGSPAVTEGIPRFARNDTVAIILRQGDLEKFSPWGAAVADFETLANRALELAPEPAVQMEVAA